MTDWEKLKVTELKEELKSRGIPLTGLKLKQQFIDKLREVEAESQAQNATPEIEVKEAGTTNQEVYDAPALDTRKELDAQDNIVPITRQEQEGQNTAEDVDVERPALLVAEESHATDDETEPEPIPIPQGEDVKTALEDDPFIPEVETREGQEQEKNQDAQTKSSLDTELEAESIAASSIKVPTPEVVEDQRKRKRRSASPQPDTQDITQKRQKTENGEEQATLSQRMALDEIQAATDQAELSRESQATINVQPLQPMQASEDADASRVAREVGSLPDATELQNSLPIGGGDKVTSNIDTQPEPEPDPVIERDVTPAKHHATKSLYIRNFKRPLHIPSLRSYISQGAKLPSDMELDKDPIQVFYLDAIRTHAFITLTSINAATRVRNLMHETRFPDELMREPLWIDFIPDEQVQSWIDEEAGQGSRNLGGFRGGRKFEVVYQESERGVEAQLREVSSETQAGGFRTQRNDIVAQSNTRTIASGIHPDRAPQIPRQPKADERSAKQSRSDTGKGFKALDELFSSTLTKPKLYYKFPGQPIIDERLDMIRDLRVGHAEMGKSGDEGMKRYTFEDDRGRQEWVDKGPEFGFGRKGQDRLVGTHGRGGGMMRGGFRRGGDSWRGR